MDCRDTRQLMSLALDGNLSPRQREHLAAHLDSCPGCSEEYDLWRCLSATMRELAVEVEAPAGFYGRVMARVQGLNGSPRRRPGWVSETGWKRLGVGVAAAAVLALGAMAANLPQGGEPLPVAQRPADSTVASAPGTSSPAAPAPGAGKPAAPQQEAPGASTTPVAATPRSSGQPSGAQAASVATPAPRPVVFLSKERRISSTLLKVAVADVSAASSRAMEYGTALQATAQQLAVQSVGDEYAVLRFVVARERYDSLVASLCGLGSVIESQQDSRDVTGDFNGAKEQYESLLAQRAAATDAELQQELDSQLAALEDQLRTLDAEAERRVVVLWLTR